MNSTLRTQATAFSLAAIVTLSLMASIHQLAAAPAPADTMAQTPTTAPVQVVVVTGKRSAV